MAGRATCPEPLSGEDFVAILLHRLGRFGARRSGMVIVGWLAVLALAVGGLVTFGGSLATGFSIPGTPTEKVNERLVEAFPELTGATGSVVFTSAEGAFTPAQQARIGEVLAGIGQRDGVAAVIDPFTAAQQRAEQSRRLDAGLAALESAPRPLTAEQETQLRQMEDATTLSGAASSIRTVSEDRTVAVAAVMFRDGIFNLSPELQRDIATALDEADIPGVAVDYSSTIAATAGSPFGIGEVIGLAVALIVLLILLRALIPALTPLLTSIVGVGVGVVGSMAFSDVVDMTSGTPILGVMLGLAVGIDYSLFILDRHRRQARDGMPVHESIGVANGTAGTAVVFAGSTVVVALVALAVTGIPFLAVMGAVAAFCVMVAVLVSITLTPALLGLMGKRVLPGRSRATVRRQKPPQPMRTGRAVAATVLVVAVLTIIAVPVMSLRLGLPDGSSEPPDSPQYRAFVKVAQGFGEGINGPLLVVAESPTPVAEADQVATQAEIVTTILRQPNVVAAAPVAVAADGKTFAFQVVPAEGPNSTTTEQLVNDLRALPPLAADMTIGVAGQASGNIDISRKLADALPVYLLVVIGLSLLIMIAVFRSLLVPIVATAGYVLSLGAALGAVTAIYQWGWLADLFGMHRPGPVLSFAPIVIMGILFGLAMDYQIFLVSGMREAFVHGRPARLSVTIGHRRGRVVVTAAAIIMIAVFGGFVFSHLTMIRPLGFGLAAGVLFDAFVVRLVLVPALMHLLGDRAWWLPAWLDRALPNVDIEGSALSRSESLSAVMTPMSRTLMSSPVSADRP
ncbi:MMPL family transporter [Verrucosispora sp. TAA-831]|uniref:MMPL family transporter n=1 Tax=Verrucosispora sp. TAA-831 TaxID=3422227 RepID=UPI003D6FE3DD